VSEEETDKLRLPVLSLSRVRRRKPLRNLNLHGHAVRALPIRAISESTQPCMKKQINFVINGKGGVGKSFFATNFVQYLKDCRFEHCAIDSDHENSTLKRFHPEAEFINLEHRREIDRVFTTAETCDLLAIDCRAASTDLFIDFFDEVGLAEVLRSLGARLTVICPLNHEADSVEQLRILSDALHDSCRWVVVKNEAHSDTFKIYDGSRTRRHVVEELSAREIAMPRMYDWLVTALNEHNATVTSALMHPAFDLLDRQRLKSWQTRFYRQLYRAADLLLNEPHVAERFGA
jgi:hypothetical protein